MIQDLVYADRVTSNRTAFIQKVWDISVSLGINPNWLMHVMMKESGLNHRAVNKMGGATGLIQFMPATARGLGTTTEALKKMSNVDQLDYVHKYLATYKGKMKSLVDTYFAVFFPAAIGWPKTKTIETSKLSASTIARYNPGIDLDKSGSITVQEVEDWILKGIPASIKDILLNGFYSAGEALQKKNGTGAGVAAADPVRCSHCGRSVVYTKNS